MLKIKPIVCIVFPCYNEEEVIPHTAREISKLLEDIIGSGKISEKSYACFVDDGSKDKTWNFIETSAIGNKLVKGVKLSGNFGHQNALLAGLFSEEENADCFITIDVDLQDDIIAIEEMVDKYLEGNKIVYGVRENRDNDSILKKHTAQLFYKLMERLQVKTIYNHADFRLIDSSIIKELRNFKEVNIFLRSIFPLMGFEYTSVHYKRRKRMQGESKYPLKKMISFAWEGITSFSVKPLRMLFYTGLIFFLLSMVLGVWVLISLIAGETIQGWASILLIILLFSGINMISLGIIGEYVGKIYIETKERPRYIIEKKNKINE
ncbi:MAG: glycosyltransferase family 2 protein [Bacteroidetes bacterium]|nr:glycosyltransferase family 2 protein [Bacteroidota bacterium]